MTQKRSLTAPGERGQSAVEFTLIFPVFLLVLLVLATMAMTGFAFETIQLAAREGASSAVHNPRQTVSAVRAEVCSNIFAMIRSQATVMVSPPDTSSRSCSNPNTGETTPPSQWASGVGVNVVVGYNVPVPRVSLPTFRGYVAVFGPFPIKAISVMTIE